MNRICPLTDLNVMFNCRCLVRRTCPTEHITDGFMHLCGPTAWVSMTTVGIMISVTLQAKKQVSKCMCGLGGPQSMNERFCSYGYRAFCG